MPVANLHITLCFLGEVDAGKLQHVEREADRLHGSGFHLQLNEYGYFPGPGIFWIGPQQVPRELVALAQALGKVAVSAGLKREKRAYVPHVTLMRKCHSRPPEPLTPPQFELSCEGFSLYQSVPVPGGVRYRALDRWLLD